MSPLDIAQKIAQREISSIQKRVEQCEYQMAWAAERKVNPRCSFKATTEIEGRKLCTFHARRLVGGTP